MRIPVSIIVGQLAHGANFGEILEGFPDLEKEDIQQAIEYAAWLAQEQVFTLWEGKMRFLADMGVVIGVVNWLRQNGHDAKHLRDEGLHRIPNGEIFAKAISENWIIITFDLVFGEIVALSKREKVSIILFRLHNIRTSHLINRLSAVLEDSAEALGEGAVVVVEESRHRVRYLPPGEK
jgi:predicted nuclease of predicted toxin-antitoxin system